LTSIVQHADNLLLLYLTVLLKHALTFTS